MYRRMSCLPPGCLHGRLCDCVGGRTDPACIDRSMYESQAQVVIKVQKSKSPKVESPKSRTQKVKSQKFVVSHPQPVTSCRVDLHSIKLHNLNAATNETTKQRSNDAALLLTSARRLLFWMLAGIGVFRWSLHRRLCFLWLGVVQNTAS